MSYIRTKLLLEGMFINRCYEAVLKAEKKCPNCGYGLIYNEKFSCYMCNTSIRELDEMVRKND